MKYFTFFALLLLSVSAGAQSQATEISQATGESSENRQEPLTEQRIQQLISTLENDTARANFIENLKTLAAAEQNQEGSGPTQVSRLLNLDETSSGVLKVFAKRLSSLGMDSSRLDQFLLFGLVVIGVLAAVLCNNYLSRFLDRKLDPARSRLHLDPSRLSIFFSLHRWFGYLFAGLLLLYAVKEVYAPWPSLLDGAFNPATLAHYSLVLMVICVTFVGV